SYLRHEEKPIHTIMCCSPINEIPTSDEAAFAILKTSQTQLVDSGFQKNAILVMDEVMFQNVVKIKDKHRFDNIYLMAGDFHALKNYMAMIWTILDGSGVHQLIGCIFQGATLRSVFNVTNFNKSLRTIKLLYTSFGICLMREYLSSNYLHISIRELLNKTPTTFHTDEYKQKWFHQVLSTTSQINFEKQFNEFCTRQSNKMVCFRFWYWIFRFLLEACVQLLVAVRSQNFDLRNACWSRMVPLFFSHNRRRYAKLGARNLADLRSMPLALQQHFSESFAVKRTKRPFSGVPVDQALESSINRIGKGRNGISGQFSAQGIDKFCQT
ncbi:unnamed protein product, partial [Didymodactylos carnosus]